MRYILTRPFGNTFYNLYLYLLGGLFLLSIIIEKGQDVLWINGHNTPVLDMLFSAVTNLGDGIIFVPIVLVMLFIRFEYAIIGTIVGISHGVLVSIFKRLLFADIERPKGFLDNSLLHFVKGVEVHSSNSFPSGHTATAFCAALFIALVSRHRIVSVLALTLAILVGYSRIYLLQHFLIDVAAGAVIGCFTTSIVWQAFATNNNKPQWMGMRLRIKVAPSSSSRRINPPNNA